MIIRNYPGLFMICLGLGICDFSAQPADSLQRIRMESVTVRSSPQEKEKRNSPLSLQFAGSQLLREQFTGNLVQTLEHLPGVRSMDIGSGFAKPVIRGMGFNRIAVLENGIKQEGQQWGGRPRPGNRRL